ncbi:acetyl-CoA carboxylase biotin carboxylase subunit [Micrococcus luteus KDCGSN]|uniref:acetyl-CoA carboxylase biotin carboxylase subunit n=1 Tax=Micrococcus luteus TaxID=1270 RepID=UPI003EEFA345
MQKVFIANRGEIALRIIRSARVAGYTTVAVASEADAQAPHVVAADESVVIGPAPATASYLNINALLDAAERTGADAVHPGYGFLSEKADFARAVIDAGLTWIGPTPDTIALMGDKVAARRAAAEAGVPILPGTDGPLADDADLDAVVHEIGVPLVVKAAAGGGGRGIRRVDDANSFAETVQAARGEAAAVFGDPTVYVERFVPRARHVEVQIAGDGENFVHLGDRDCSWQRRSQKVIEEAPAPGLPEDVRERIRRSSVELARRAGYCGVGTVEFLYDPVRREAAFIEMNTRLQVEHPVTEEVTGIDLVAEQLRIAEGLGLSFRQEDVIISGHAIECRLNAEDPAKGFFPSPGAITTLVWPDGEGVRIDAGIEEGTVVAPYYDSMIAKLIVHADDRSTAIEQMGRALADVRIDGIVTTIPAVAALVARAEFAAVEHHTTLIEKSPEILEAP